MKTKEMSLEKLAHSIQNIDVWLGDENLRPELTNPDVQLAYEIAVCAHAGTVRKTGEPYINHPLRTAKRVESYEVDYQIVALLHDVVEDTDFTLDELSMFFDSRVIRALDSVTHREGESYSDFIIRCVTGGSLPMVVKIADTLDNSSPEQLSIFPPAKRRSKRLKYRTARTTLIASVKRSEELREALRAELILKGEL